MLARDNTYFHPELCLDGHYIITGLTNDRVCNDLLQLTDFKYELFHYLRHRAGFEAVIFFDSLNMLYCYDQESFNILRGLEDVPGPAATGERPSDEVTRASPLGHRRRRRRGESPAEAPPAQASPAPAPAASGGPLTMGVQSMQASWAQVMALVRHTNHRCAIILSNVDSLLCSMNDQSMAILEELRSFHSVNRSIILYLFRETTLTTLRESVTSSSAAATSYWARLVQNVLLSRADATSPDRNRVITIQTPNPSEVRNLLSYLRLRERDPLHISFSSLNAVARELAASCARQNWELQRLYTRLDLHIHEHPETVLSLQTVREFTGEAGYVGPLERIEGLIGLEDRHDAKGALLNRGMKTYVRELYARKRKTGAGQGMGRSYSRLDPPQALGHVDGNELNIVLRGNPGTGKTTIARIMADLYYELGLLPQGQLVECSAADLVSDHVGGTAATVRSWVHRAIGGVLFVDEAYALASDAHGREAIDQLVNDLTAYEGQFAVVLAGYPEPMSALLRDSNPGLARRFPNDVLIEDYTPDEMRRIFELMVAHDPDGAAIGDELREVLPTFCEAWVGGKTGDWGNAGEAQKLLAAMKKRCSSRLALAQNDDAALTLTPADVPEQLQHCLVPRSQSLEAALAEIDAMIGLTEVKQFLRKLAENVVWEVDGGGPGNYIFSGSPGTGKTTVARKVGEILGHLGVLRRKVNNVVECRAGDLLNGSVELADVVRDARGGVLFLDEAHQLEQSPAGHAIIRALVPYLEDPQIRADTCFICAGYPAEMERFLKVDRGLNRRFPATNRIRFDDYSASELVQILAKMAQDRGELTDNGDFAAYLARSRVALERYLEERQPDFGNGGFVRDIYLPESIHARAERLTRAYATEEGSFVTRDLVHRVSDEERRTLTAEDIPPAFRRLAGPLGSAPPRERDARVLLSELYGKDEFVDYATALFDQESEEEFFDDLMKVGMHYAVSGPEGSGRHTAIRAMARVRKELGHLTRDDVTYVGKADLEGEYVGQTSGKAREIVAQALGGTLVVCYPSAMLPKNSLDNTFGPEALAVIKSAMSAHFDDLCVVFLDSVEGMEEFIKADSSVRSHLAKQFVFEDLDHEDMYQLFREKTRESMVFDEELERLLPDLFLNWVSDRGGLGDEVLSWGNGLEAERLIESLVRNWKRDGGASTLSEITRDGATYTVRRRVITRRHFPKDMEKYLVSNRVASDDALRMLDAMTGLESVKRSIAVIERRMRRMPQGSVNPGLYCYMGNPGVGKTTVARIMGGVLKATGALSQGHVIIRTVRQMYDAIGEFDATIRLARNGILFIDEAHQLAEPGNVQGRSVIKRLLTVLEDPDVIKNTAIILAGYPMAMVRLFDQDEGLASRFGTKNSIILFEDYTPEELSRILEVMAASADTIVQIGTPTPLRLSDGYKARALEVFRAVVKRGDPNFGNARFARNLLHDSVDMMLERLDETYGRDGAIPPEELDYLTEEDVPYPFGQSATERVSIRLQPSDIATTGGDEISDESLEERCQDLYQSTVFLECYSDGVKTGEGTGTIITAEGIVLTCAHVTRDCDRIRAHVYSPGMIGGDYRWFECAFDPEASSPCDMALIKMEGTNFHPMAIRPPEEPIALGEETMLIGFPLGTMLAGYNVDGLTATQFSGRVASVQRVRGIKRYYIDSTGLHGNSGSPVIAKRDGRMIGVFSGAVIPRGANNRDELNYFYSTANLWSEFMGEQS